MAIAFYSEGCDSLPKRRRKLSAWVKKIVKAEGYSVGEISFVFCSPDYHIEINRQYLGHDYHTDVITFDYSDLVGARTISGDILIDPRRVSEQAIEWDSEPDMEMLRVMIHGVLHLCGYGDKSDEEQALMRAKEDACLAQL